MNRRKLIQCLAVASLLLGTASCINDDYGVDGCNQGPANVRLMVQTDATRSIGSGDTDNEVRQLRVYAFNAAGERVGYAYVEDVPQGTFYVPVSLSESGNIRFYVLANDGFATGASVPGDLGDLTQQQLNRLYFTGWQEVGGECISPMVNNATVEGTYSYLEPVQIQGNTSGWQIVPVNVQHILARLRLMLNKEGDGEVVINRAAVRHRPDNYMLFTPQSVNNVVTFNNNSEQAVDEFVAEDVMITQQAATGGVQTYQEIGRTFLKPNAYGSSNPDEYVAYADYDDVSKSYVLSIDYSVGGTAKEATVYLPRVLRNQSIEVEGTLKSGRLELQANVVDWIDGPSSNIDYSDEYEGQLDVITGARRTTDGAAYAVVYGTDAQAADRYVSFEMTMTLPAGATWTANLTNGSDFEVYSATGAASGMGDGQPVTFTVRPRNPFVPGTTPETELFITLTRLVGGNPQKDGAQVINPEEGGVYKHPGDLTHVKIRQVSLDEWNQLQ